MIRFSFDFVVDGPFRPKTADPHETLRLCSEVEVGAPGNHPKITRKSFRTRLEKAASKRRAETSAPNPPETSQERPEVPGDSPRASRECPGSAQSRVRSVPGASPKSSESPKIGPRAPGAIWSRSETIWDRFSLHFALSASFPDRFWNDFGNNLGVDFDRFVYVFCTVSG